MSVDICVVLASITVYYLRIIIWAIERDVLNDRRNSVNNNDSDQVVELLDEAPPTKRGLMLRSIKILSLF